MPLGQLNSVLCTAVHTVMVTNFHMTCLLIVFSHNCIVFAVTYRMCAYSPSRTLMDRCYWQKASEWCVWNYVYVPRWGSVRMPVSNLALLMCIQTLVHIYHVLADVEPAGRLCMQFYPKKRKTKWCVYIHHDRCDWCSFPWHSICRHCLLYLITCSVCLFHLHSKT